MDLLGRKLGMKKGKLFLDYLGLMQKTISDARQIPALNYLTEDFETGVTKLAETALYLSKTAMSDTMNAFTFAHPFLDVTGDLTMAWMLLWRTTIAYQQLVKLAGSDDMTKIREKASTHKDAAFYYGQLKTAEFFIKTLLPITMGKFNAINGTNGAAVEMLDASFGG
jgi:hypothetical protein